MLPFSMISSMSITTLLHMAIVFNLFLFQVQHYLLLTIEGTVSPMSFVTDILFPYALDNVGKHVATTYDTEETQHDIDLLRSQVRFHAIIYCY